jgi:hypothetical protein
MAGITSRAWWWRWGAIKTVTAIVSFSMALCEESRASEYFRKQEAEVSMFAGGALLIH